VTRPPEPELPGDVIPDAAEMAGWPPSGPLRAEVRVGPAAVRLDRAERGVIESLARWTHAPERTPEAAPRWSLALEVLRSERPGYLSLGGPGAPARLLAWPVAGGLAMATHHAALLVDARAERGLLALTMTAGPGNVDLALQNALRVAVAWGLLARRSGLLLHAAAVEEAGRAVLFVGAHGDGKSTAARASAPRATLADDVAVVERQPAGAPWLLWPTPLWAEPDFPGRAADLRARPVALACTLGRGQRVTVERLPAARATAALLARVPFAAGPELAAAATELAGELATSVPVVRLERDRDADFWPGISEQLAAPGPFARDPR
jgi:hypothetical protein